MQKYVKLMYLPLKYAGDTLAEIASHKAGIFKVQFSVLYLKC